MNSISQSITQETSLTEDVLDAETLEAQPLESSVPVPVLTSMTKMASVTNAHNATLLTLILPMQQ
jgi:hypothetical protein